MNGSEQNRSSWSVTPRDIARYTFLPGIIPRIREFFRMPLAPLAALMAEVLSIAALIPPNHPYLRSDRVGTYGVRDVLRLAMTHMRWDLKHIDQIIVFFALLSALVTGGCLLVSAAVYIAFPPASAMNVSDHLPALMANIYRYTQTPNPGRDVALMLLDRTLGVVGNTSSGSFFGSDVPVMCAGGEIEMSKNANCLVPPFPAPLHAAFLAMLQFYSTAIFMFTVLFFLYLLSTVVMDVAMKGKPMGRGVNAFWTPLRVVAALGLMIPLAPQGLNSAQYIVLYSAKIGSAMATNAWGYFHAILDSQMGITNRNPAGVSSYRYDMGGTAVIPQSSPMAIKLQAPDVTPLVRFLHTVATCEYYYEHYRGYTGKAQVQGYFYKMGNTPIPAYTEQDAGNTDFVPYKDALDYFKYGSIRIVFGSYDGVKKEGPMGGVVPLCGELVIPVTSLNTNTGKPTNPGSAKAQELYYGYVLGLFDKTTYPRKLMDGYARQMITNLAGGKKSDQCKDYVGQTVTILKSPDDIELTELGPCNQIPPPTYIQYQEKLFQGVFQALIDAANAELATPSNFAISDDTLKRGWAAAGTWFQHVARLNGDYVSAVQQMPYGAKRPPVMDEMRSAMAQVQVNIPDPNKFCDLSGASGKGLSNEDKDVAKVLCQIEMNMNRDFSDVQFIIDPNAPQDPSGINAITTEKNRNKTENIVFKLFNAVFGSDLLFSACHNANTHPFTQIVVFGRLLMERVLRNIVTGSAIAAQGGIVSIGNADMGSALGKIAGAYHGFASLMFSAGFMLYYVLPLLPFVYFFFAMLAWVKAVFEGLIGAPLWAFAHMKLDGNGFGTSGARQGYLLILEIFLRPIVTVFALIMGLGVFAGSVYMLRETMEMFSDVMGRPSSPDQISCKLTTETLRGILDVFFFNLFYILLIYMVSLSSFKLIDGIPNKVMRWFGSAPKSLAVQSADSDHAGQRFSSQSFVVLANPLQGLIDKGDEMVGNFFKTSAKLADKDGHIKAAVQQTFGKDLMTQAKEHIAGNGKDTKGVVGPWAETHAEHVKNAKTLKSQLEKGTLTDTQRAALAEQIEKEERLAKLFDPAQLYQEALIENSTKLKSLAKTPEEMKELEIRVREMKDVIRTTQRKVWESLNMHSEGPVGQGEVQRNVRDLILSTKKDALRKKK